MNPLPAAEAYELVARLIELLQEYGVTELNLGAVMRLCGIRPEEAQEYDLDRYRIPRITVKPTLH